MNDRKRAKKVVGDAIDAKPNTLASDEGLDKFVEEMLTGGSDGRTLTQRAEGLLRMLEALSEVYEVKVNLEPGTRQGILYEIARQIAAIKRVTERLMTPTSPDADDVDDRGER